MINAIQRVEVSADGKDVEPAKQWTTAAEKQKLEDAVKAAEEVRDRSGVTLSQLRTAESTLKAAIDAYNDAKKAGTKVATTPPAGATPEQIKELTDLLNKANNTDTTGKTEESTKALEDAIKKAEEILAKEPKLSGEVNDATKALTDAIDGLKDAVNDSGDLTSKKEALTSELGNVVYVDVSPDGSNVPVDKKWTTQEVIEKMQAAETAAKDVLDNPNATAAELDKALADLKSAIDTYNKAQENGLYKDRDPNELATDPDKNRLEEQLENIVYVKVSTDGSDISPLDKWTTPQEKVKLEAVVTAAKTVLAKTGATVSEVNDAVNSVRNANVEYIAAQQLGTQGIASDSKKAELKDLMDKIVEVQVSSNGADVPQDKSWTTQAELDKLRSEVAAAEAVFNTPNVTTVAIDRAIDDLTVAIEAYEAAQQFGTKASQGKIDGLKDLIDAATGKLSVKNISEAKDGSEYDSTDMWTTQEQVALLEDAIEKAQGIVNNADKMSEAIIDEAIRELTNAIDLFDQSFRPGTQDADITTTADSAEIKVLTDLIDAITSDVDMVAVSIDGQEVEIDKQWTTQAVKNRIEAALDAAQTVAESPQVIAFAVDLAVANLKLEEQIYNNAKQYGKKVSVLNIPLKAFETGSNAQLGGIMDTTGAQTDYSTVGLSLAGAVNANILSTKIQQSAFTVPKDSLLSFKFKYEKRALVGLGGLNLVVLKKNPVTGAYETVWNDTYGYLSVLGIPNTVEREVKNLTEGEYILLANNEADDGPFGSILDLALVATDTFEILEKSLLNNSSSVNTANPNINLERSGNLLTNQTSKIVTVKSKPLSNSTITEAGMNGNLTVAEDGTYTYVSNGDPQSIGKVDIFEFEVETDTQRKLASKLYVRHDLDGAPLIWDDSNLSSSVPFIPEAVNDTANASLVGNKVSEKTITVGNSSAALGRVVDIPFTINNEYDVLTFTPRTWTVVKRALKYEVIDNATGKSIYTESIELGGLGEPREVRGMKKGSYTLRITPPSGGYDHTVDNMKVRSVDWRVGNAKGNVLTNDEYLGGLARLSVGNPLILADDTMVAGNYGMLKMSPNGDFEYIPNASFDSYNKVEEFIYKIVAANGDQRTVKLTITMDGTITTLPINVKQENVYQVTQTSAAAPFIFSLNDSEEIFVTSKVSFNS